MKMFNTFANSPLSNYLSPKAGSSHVAPSHANQYYQPSLQFHRNATRINSKRQSTQNKHKKDKAKKKEQEKQHNLYQSKVSELLSHVSLPIYQQKIDKKRLLSLQTNITQSLLQMRQLKIHLMEELSKSIDVKNLYEYYMTLKFHQSQDRTTKADSRLKQSNNRQKQYVPIGVSAPILKRNQELHLKLRELQIKEQIFGPNYEENLDPQKNKKLMQEILQVRELKNKLKLELSQKLKNQGDKQSQSRFVTFLPQDRQKHFQSKNIFQQLQELKQRHAKLLSTSRQSQVKLSNEERAYLQSLKRQNIELQSQVEEMLEDKRANYYEELKRTREHISDEKHKFLEEFQRFRQALDSLKQENQYFKRELVA